MNKIKPSDLIKQAQELHQQGKMPDLDTLLSAVADTRKKYRDQILAARNEHPSESGVNALKS